jgi:hypothetical protein
LPCNCMAIGDRDNWVAHRPQMEAISLLVARETGLQGLLHPPEVVLMADLNEIAHDLMRLREIEWSVDLLLIEVRQIYQRIAPGDDERFRAHLAASILVPQTYNHSKGK